MKKRPSLVSAAVVAALVFLSACHDPLPVPRIDASLDGWTQPYQGLAGLKVHAFRTGAARSVEAATFEGGSWTSLVEMGAWAFVIEHPTQGLIVFDTGMSRLARSEPERYVGWLGAKLNMLDVPENATLSEQMKAARLDPGDVRYVILSHLHFDHTGDLGAFPNAKVVVAAAEKSWVEAGVRRIDFVDTAALVGMPQWQTIDYAGEKPLASFVAAHDLFGDGSIFTLDLAGHTPGSQGLLVRAPEAPLLFTGDASWTEKSWRWAAKPISAFDMSLWWEQIWRIRKFAMLEPLLIVVPGHDDMAVATIGIPSFVHHDAPGSAKN